MSIYQSNYTGQQIDERLEWAANINPHIALKMNTESGIHGIRYWQDTLEYYDGSEWIEIVTGGGGGSVTVKTASQWASENPILLLGELGVEGDTNKIKIGNGTSRWNSLPYMAQGEPGPKGDPGEDGQEIQLRVNGGYIQWSYVGGVTWINLIAVIDLIGPPGQKGDPGQDGEPGQKGETGNPGSSIQSITRTSGTGAPGTTDTYTVTLTDGSTSQFFVYNGADGSGAGDMQSSIYDPQGKATNIFAYVDNGLSNKVDNVAGKGLSTNDYTTPDKSKLAGIADNANNYTHPAYTPRSQALQKVTVDVQGHVSTVAAVTKADITALGIPAQDTVYTHPTTPGNKHIPSGGTNGKVLGYDSDGTAKWVDPPAGVEIANNLTTTVPGKALDAIQGKALADSISTKSDKSTIQSKTLSTASWTGSAVPYSYTLSVTGVTATSIQEILPTTDITETQLTALLNATIQDGGQSTNSITLKAWGTKPTIDIPIRVILRGDM